MKYEFRALEDGGGGLHIIITEGEKLVYAGTGFELSDGYLSQIIIDMYNDVDIEVFDENIMYDEEILQRIRSENEEAVTDEKGDIIPMTLDEAEGFFGLDEEFCTDVVADCEGIYWNRMGFSARKDFGMLTLAQVSELFENISIS